MMSRRRFRWRIRSTVPTALVAVIAAVGMFVGPGAPARAATMPDFFSWQPGTTVPTIPAGYTALAWPSSKVLGQLQPGQTVPTTQISNTAEFEAKAPSLTATANGDPVNLELVPAAPAASATAPATPTASPTETASGTASPVSSASGNGSSSLAAPALAASPDATCSTSTLFQQDIGYTYANVGESFSEIPNVTQAFQYSVTRSQSTTFSVGVSASGKAGTFSASGTETFDTGYTSTQAWPRETGVINNAWATSFEWGLYEHFDNCFPSNDYWFIEPYEWTAGTKITHPSSVPALNASNCRTELNGANFQANNSTATTITHGFDVSGGTIASVGFSGSTQTGYSPNAQIGFDFNQDGWLCGNNGPPNYAGQYVAHA